MFRRYLQVTKPGIIMGNLISVAGGFLLASRGDVDGMLMVATLLGLSLVVASGCAVNNCIDRDIDARMQRTRTRVLHDMAVKKGMVSLSKNGVEKALAGLTTLEELERVLPVVSA